MGPDTLNLRFSEPKYKSYLMFTSKTSHAIVGISLKSEIKIINNRWSVAHG